MTTILADANLRRLSHFPSRSLSDLLEEVGNHGGQSCPQSSRQALQKMRLSLKTKQVRLQIVSWPRVDGECWIMVVTRVENLPHTPPTTCPPMEPNNKDITVGDLLKEYLEERPVFIAIPDPNRKIYYRSKTASPPRTSSILEPTEVEDHSPASVSPKHSRIPRF